VGKAFFDLRQHCRVLIPSTYNGDSMGTHDVRHRAEP
jgi:hypothetical protein